jgi:hypothetical protein
MGDEEKVLILGFLGILIAVVVLIITAWPDFFPNLYRRITVKFSTNCPKAALLAKKVSSFMWQERIFCVLVLIALLLTGIFWRIF